ncbi:putative carbonic anhydrase 3 [Sitophilus oryzae]|uniref:Carbonic anhydrase 3 n=1 Tax=Sitophilus oryzae TaxID=7048 RepID=A0A6J2X868_SITOR|nr:putative carbonic anhydrase 3 [Sitophilus oryzae]
MDVDDTPSEEALTTVNTLENIERDEESDIDVSDSQRAKDIFYGTAIFESPADIDIIGTKPVEDVPMLTWVNFEIPPKKMKITNSGHTVILSGKWGQERPYITGGTLTGKYVFSQLHLHWGVNSMEGSEHTVDGCRQPGEMHVVTFKSCYLTQESALKESDGVAILVYMFKLQDKPNAGFSIISDALTGIAKAHTSMKVNPIELTTLVKQFTSDYFMYRGSVSTTNCVHYITWMITRVPMGVSNDQVDSLRYLLDDNDDLIKRNFRPVQLESNRSIFHVLPSTSKYSTLLPLTEYDDKTVTQIYRMEFDRRSNPLFQFGTSQSESILENSEVESDLYSEEEDGESEPKIGNKALCIVRTIKKYISSVFYGLIVLFL